MTNDQKWKQKYMERNVKEKQAKNLENRGVDTSNSWLCKLSGHTQTDMNMERNTAYPDIPLRKYNMLATFFTSFC
ncbi:unnamed protein product [Ceratitis capitata]|uniref:(Mediterranean fruit fly) hypothetical protein n=1 Tax=Ceratitis capitata TaxID=7213 RepID=A0A811V1C1_CERCA|nr:unnamed protein product [Ceratitis capitata]